MAPGTCGELAQGMLDGILCMVTCPIDVYSTATVELSPGESGIVGPSGLPEGAAGQCRRHWTIWALRAWNARLVSGLPSAARQGDGQQHSRRGGGHCRHGRRTGPGTLPGAGGSEIALGVEPSDGVMFPNVSIFDHRKGRIAVTLGTPPPMRVVVLDFGGSVDTLEFNRTDRDEALKRLGPRMAEAVSLIKDGIVRGDPLRIGHGATVSAVANQEVLFNPHLETSPGTVPESGGGRCERGAQRNGDRDAVSQRRRVGGKSVRAGATATAGTGIGAALPHSGRGRGTQIVGAPATRKSRPTAVRIPATVPRR